MAPYLNGSVSGAFMLEDALVLSCGSQDPAAALGPHTWSWRAAIGMLDESRGEVQHASVCGRMCTSFVRRFVVTTYYYFITYY